MIYVRLADSDLAAYLDQVFVTLDLLLSKVRHRVVA